ncbi:MAG: T9SS type B sorting domain-containing protein, partial [Bacteroidetes bacterium]|nr:T9SS type B sorting domain-containing protein [Bacteroidota bacterium]
GNNKCAGNTFDVDIWVEPTPTVVLIPQVDTICDNDQVNIEITSTTNSTLPVEFRYIIEPENPSNIIITYNGPVTGLSNGDIITDNLDNTSDVAQKVLFIFNPYTIDGNGNDRCDGIADTTVVYVNPTPRVIVSIARDTICNNTRTSITLTTPSVLTDGQVTFDYTSDPDPFLTGNTTGNNLTDPYIIEDLLNNSTSGPAYPQVVRYTVTPYAASISCPSGPVITDSITVHPTADTYMSTDSVRCYLESNGTATVLAENGVNIFTYEWDDPLSQTTATATGLVENGYTVTVTDNQGCTKTDFINVWQPDLLVPFIDTVKNVSCNGKFDGYIISNPYGGNGQYDYLWSTGETTDSIGGLNGNYYYLTVTDWKGCYKDTTLLVDEPPQTSMDILAKHISCYGANDGELEVDAIGLTNYEWSTGATSAKITNLHAGFYSVTAYNAEGCRSSQSQQVHEPDPLVIDSIVPGPISCAGDADGTIDLYISGGNTINYYQDIPFEEPYDYSWSTTDGTGLTADIQNQTGLSGGTYYVTVSDWRNCMANDSATVNEPPIFESNIISTDVTCFGDNNGEIDLQVTGGNTEDPYTFVWTTPNGSGLNESSEDQSGLTQGNYYVTIYDAKDCELQNSAIINEPPLLEATLSENDLKCFGINNGTAVVDITGGTGAYSIEWSTGSTEDSIYNLTAGNYSVTVIDANGCDTINNFQLSEPDEIESSIESENITCFGYSNGKIIITPTGGTIPYNYVWSDASIANDSIAENLGPGEYTISVIDNNNCEHTRDIELTQPDPLTADVEKSDISCYGEIDGYIVLNMFGGTPEYTYSWSNGLSEPSANMLSEGDYSITVTDIHDCLIDTTVHIEEPDELIINPVVIRPTCPDIENGSINLNISGGRTPYIVYWDNGSFDENLSEIRSGIYDVLITDSSLCEMDTSFTVRSAHDFCIDVPTAFSPNDDNINDRWEIDMQGLYPYAEIEIFDRWGNRVFYSKGYEESQYWDGTFNGKKLPMDNYFYIIYLRNGSRRISGTVTLLR